MRLLRTRAPGAGSTAAGAQVTRYRLPALWAAAGALILAGIVYLIDLVAGNAFATVGLLLGLGLIALTLALVYTWAATTPDPEALNGGQPVAGDTEVPSGIGNTRGTG